MKPTSSYHNIVESDSMRDKSNIEKSTTLSLNNSVTRPIAWNSTKNELFHSNFLKILTAVAKHLF